MILAVDIGNTHIVMGCVDGDKISNITRMATDSLKTEFEYAATMKQLFSFVNIDSNGFEGSIISSVVPPLTTAIGNAVKLLTGKEALVVGSGIKTGLNILIDNPAQLGSDLVVGSVAAVTYYKAPIVVIDMGTATTFSVIDAKGCHIGGAILPGLNLSLNALSRETSQLPKISIDPPKHCIGRNTIDCMRSGAVFGTASMVDGMIDRIEEEVCGNATVIATGGLSQFIIPYCRHSIVYDEELLLKGLGIIYKKNIKK